MLFRSYNKPVLDVIKQYMGLTLVVSFVTLFFHYIVAIPIGIYTAVKQYSAGDYFFSGLSFIGMATPNFLLAIILMFFSYKWFGDPLLGLFSPEYVNGCYYALCDAAGHDYWYLVGEPAPGGDVAVDLDALRRTLEAAGLAGGG